MGYLTISPITTRPNGRYVEDGATSLKEGSPEKPVIANFQIGSRSFKYAISGISLGDVLSIPMLYPYLRHVLTYDSLEHEKKQDPNYEVPRELTFSDGRNCAEKITLTSSFRALAKLLDDVAGRRAPGIKSLLIDDEAQYYQETKGNWRKSGFELVTLAFPKIQPFHFTALTTLQVKITTNSTIVLNGINDLFVRGCFPNLKSLDLPINGACPTVHENGWLSFTANRELQALKNLLVNGLLQANLPFLEELRLPILLSSGRPPALALLRKVYPTLKKLVVDSIYPTAVYKGIKVDWEQQCHEQYYISGPYQDKWVSHSYTEEHYAAELEVLKESVGPTLVSVLKEMKDQSKLEAIEIHAEGLNGVDHDQADYQAIAELILSDALPNLKMLSMGPKSKYYRHFYDITEKVGDATELLVAVITKNVPLQHLALTMPDQKGYQPWLDHMAEHGFPKLQSFHYMIPRKIKGEPNEVHIQRQERALQTILTAVRSGKLPTLSSMVFQGLGTNNSTMLSEATIHPCLKSLISEIDNAVAQQRQPGFVHHEYSASLSTSSASSSEIGSDEECASSSSLVTPPASPNRTHQAQAM